MSPISIRNKPSKAKPFSWSGPRTVAEFQTRAFAANLNITTVYDPRVIDIKTVNFHPTIAQDSSGRCHCVHTTHDRHEEGLGMWCRWWTSDDRGTTWIERGEIMPSLMTRTLETSSTRIGPLPIKIVEVKSRVFCLFDINRNGGLDRPAVGILAVEMTGDSFSAPFWIHPGPVVPESGFPQYAYDAELAGLLLREIDTPYGVSWVWGTGNLFPPNPDSTVGGPTNEFQKTRIGGKTYIVARGTAGDLSQKIMAHSDDGVDFHSWAQTNIPYGTSRTCWKKFSDRYIMLVNTDSTTRWMCLAAYSADGLNYTNANTELIRPHTTAGVVEIDDFEDVNKMPTQPLFAGTAKSGATSYFDVCELDNGQYLAAMGERGKEVIRTARWTPMALT